MKLKAKVAMLCAVAICLAGVLWMTAGNHRDRTTMTNSHFLEQVRDGHVASAIVSAGKGGAVPTLYRLKDGNSERTVLPADYRDAMLAMEGRDGQRRDPGRFFRPAQPLGQLTPVLVAAGFLDLPDDSKISERAGACLGLGAEGYLIQPWRPTKAPAADPRVCPTFGMAKATPGDV
jgi:hypothetical protein